MSQGDKPDDGLAIVRNMMNFTFDSGVSGNVTINARGDRKVDYSIIMFQPTSVPDEIQVGVIATVRILLRNDRLHN